MIKRLRIKFVCITMALSMAMLLVVLVLLYHFTAVNLEEGSLAALKGAMSSQSVPGPHGFGSQPCFLLCEAPDGGVFVLDSGYYDLSDEDMVDEIWDLARTAGGDTGVIREYSLRFYREKGIWGQRYAFTDISAELATLRDLVATCVCIGVAGFAGFLIISILLARWAIHPVEKAFEQQKQFVSDASHELKTPLTVILTNAELLQSPDYGAEDKRQFAESILDVSRQMRSLVENLLQLARADRGQQKLNFTVLDFSALAENSLLTFEPVYFERELMLESHLEPGLKVNGDSGALRQVVDILLDNGQKYSTHTAAAVMNLTKQGKKVHLRFFTPGEPLTPAQCTDIFKRFYRVDEARTYSGSYGLGLSIARNIVDAHGGRIWAEGAEGGNVFHVTLPEA